MRGIRGVRTWFGDPMSTSINLFEIAQDARALLDNDEHFDPETGEMSEALIEQLGKVTNKGRAVCAYILNRESEVALIDGAIKKMMDRKQAAAKRAASMRRYLMDQMRMTGIQSIKADDGSFEAKLYIERDEAVEITDESAIDDALFDVKVSKTPSRTRIKAAIKAGEAVAGAKIVRRDRLSLA